VTKVILPTTRSTLHRTILHYCCFPMSAGNEKSDLSTSNFATIFEAASSRYKTLTGQDLGTHPFAVALESYNSPDSVLEVFGKQAQTFHRFRKGDGKLIAYLTLIVNMLFTLSATLEEGIDLVSYGFLNILMFVRALFLSHSRPRRGFSLELVSSSG